MKKFLCLALFAIALVGSMSQRASAAIVNFDVVGRAGFGLLPGNEPGSITGGTGGEIGQGITFDNVTNQLRVNVAWGSANGFTDLTSNVSVQHIHGPTANNFGATGAGDFNDVAPVLFNLTRTSNSPSSGQILEASNTLALSAQNVTDLFNGKFYINVHTTTNGGGEIRGFLVQAVAVPEPCSMGLLAVGGIGLVYRRYRTRPAAPAV